MESYKHILLAVDFYEHNNAVVYRAQDLANKYQAKLSIIHVVDNMPMIDAGYGADIMRKKGDGQYDTFSEVFHGNTFAIGSSWRSQTSSSLPGPCA